MAIHMPPGIPTIRFRGRPSPARRPRPITSGGFPAQVFEPGPQRGPAAHVPGTGFGDDSPLGRIYALGGHVLLLGVDHASDTSLHLAESRAAFPQKSVGTQGAPVRVNGVRQWITFEELDFDASDFASLGHDFAAETGLEQNGPIGWGEGRLAPQRPLVDYAVPWIGAHRA